MYSLTRHKSLPKHHLTWILLSLPPSLPPLSLSHDELFATSRRLKPFNLFKPGFLITRRCWGEVTAWWISQQTAPIWDNFTRSISHCNIREKELILVYTVYYRWGTFLLPALPVNLSYISSMSAMVYTLTNALETNHSMVATPDASA